MKISKEARRTSRQLFRACFAGGKLDEARVRSVVRMLSERKPRGFIAILESLARLVRSEIERQSAFVESATPLSADLQAQLRTSLARKYGRELALQFQVRPELLGGIRVQVGSDVWDGSIRARLDNLKTSLS